MKIDPEREIRTTITNLEDIRDFGDAIYEALKQVIDSTFINLSFVSEINYFSALVNANIETFNTITYCNIL